MIDKLLVVAHPDDDVIFAGNELIKEKGWKIICVTNSQNLERKKEFQSVMKKLGVEEFEIWDYPDIWRGDFNRVSLKNDLLRVVQEREYRKIVTHNIQGEYGHSQHARIGIVMREIVHKNLYTFCLGKKTIGILNLIRKCLLLRDYKSQKSIIYSKKVRKYVFFECIEKVA